MDLGLQDQSVFVAGSSRGIGKGIASVFLDEGARVLLTGRDQRSVAAACSELSQGRAERVMTFVGDLTDPAAVREAQQLTAFHWGPLDCLVCNVGSGSARNGWELARSDWDSVFGINFWIAAGLVEAFLPSMVEARRGNIIFISSIAGLESLGAPIPYGAAKAALERYSKDLSRQVGKFGIRVNTVAPGNILFPGGTWQRKLDADRERVESLIASEVPLERFGGPDEIGAAAAFLASRRSAFITGACLVADGGQTRA